MIDDMPPDMAPWVKATGPLGDFGDHTYFHGFVADQLFGTPPSDGNPASAKPPTFDTYKRTDLNSDWFGDKLLFEKDLGFAVKRFGFRVTNAELRIMSRGQKRLAVVTVAVLITKAAQCAWKPDMGEALRSNDFPDRPFTLADAQDALDWMRRVYPRWWRKTPFKPIPGDTLYRVFRTTPDTSGPDEQDMDETFANTGRVPLLPWVRGLIRPLVVDGPLPRGTGNTAPPNARHMNDERAYMASVVTLNQLQRDGETLSEQQTMLALRQGDQFRLAEADRSGPGTNYYSPDFNRSLRDAIFYDRHAPHKDADPGRTTYYMFSHKHICAATTWDQATDDMGDYYRHMHMLCVFEYHQLLVFSQNLSDLVRRYRDNRQDDERFLEDLQKIRADFLTHTHLHHFSNVSSQLQPREIYDRLYTAFGIEKMFREVDEELRSATDFAATLRTQAQARRDSTLNEYVALGIPAALAVGLGGMNLLVGAESFDLAMFNDKAHPLAWQIGQFSLLVAFSFVAWNWFTTLFLKPSGQDKPVEKSATKPALVIAGVSAVISFVAYGYLFMQS
ncbi:hypothetical protein [Litoreibacter janthinus]|uniref:hypothetical protein n=1 Tax=Litoreibacter janthinus TaxID=670154 RepID=UPI0011134783|nr:hypothetical protein [Litoreibacter janthinus]